MKVELDEYEIWQLQYLVQDKIKKLDELSENRIFCEDVRKINKDNSQMFSDILNKLKQAC